jgi:peptidoglycan/LPS O-acetylase OafA/YrhL
MKTERGSPERYALHAGNDLPAWIVGGRIPSLDGVRAIAILLVIYAHANIPCHNDRILSAIRGRSGFLGVQVFFVLSGFLITTLMLREVARTGQLSRSGFYLRRALRILPAYLTYLAVVAVVPWGEETGLTRADWLTALTYTVNFHPAPIPFQISHVWSLSVEEHFYLLWPLVMAACSCAGSLRAVIGCIIACLSFRCLLWVFLPDAAALDLWTCSRMDDIAFGCLLALLTRSRVWRHRLDQIAASLWVVSLVLGALAISQVFGSRTVGARLIAPSEFAMVAALSNTVNALCISLLLWRVMTRPTWLIGWVLNCWLLTGIGAISYSLYLWHVLFCEPEPGFLNAFPQNIVLMFAVALLSYHLVEKRFLALKDRLSSGPAPRRQPPIAGDACDELMPPFSEFHESGPLETAVIPEPVPLPR